jgi:hypothetical protein
MLRTTPSSEAVQAAEATVQRSPLSDWPALQKARNECSPTITAVAARSSRRSGSSPSGQHQRLLNGDAAAGEVPM